MRMRLDMILYVTPETFWQRLFFDAEYLDGLYHALGFSGFALQSMETDAEGRVQRTLRVVPQFHAPAIVRRKLEGKLYYVEEGVYEPEQSRWSFRTLPSVAADHARITGTIRAEPHPEGLRHVFELEAQVTAFGLGPLIERAVEKNTRDSMHKTGEFTNAYAARVGLLGR
jgi:hypothetical protein